MKKYTFLLSVLVLFLLSGFYARGQESKAPENNQDRIEMYYFHTSFRCATCRTVEEQSKIAFESLYPEKFEEGLASFQAVNIDEDANAELVEKYKISGQTLLVVRGDHTADLTSQAFLYAKTNPDKLKGEIKEAVDNL